VRHPIRRIRVQIALWQMRRAGHLSRERDENGKWLYSLTEEGKRWTEREQERRGEARMVAHEQRRLPRVPANGREVAAEQMLRGNWWPR
jgi:DNA-binding transcriptional regulator PaaX